MYSVLALYTDKLYKMVHVHYVINFTILSSNIQTPNKEQARQYRIAM